MAFNSSLCNFSTADLTSNGNMVNRDPGNNVNCVCGQPAHLHPAQPQQGKSNLFYFLYLYNLLIM